MFAAIPASKNEPLFSLFKGGAVVPLTDSVARKHLKQVSTVLNIHPSLTFHTFRRSATTWAFHNGVPMQHIMHQGTWSSNAVWRYIQSLPSQSSLVAQTFQSPFHPSLLVWGLADFYRHLLLLLSTYLYIISYYTSYLQGNTILHTFYILVFI